MRTLAVLAAIVSLVLVVRLALGGSDESRPAGIAEKNWIPISDRLGFVVVEPKEVKMVGQTDLQVLLAPPNRFAVGILKPQQGYFVVKTTAGWVHLVVTEAI